MPNKLIILRHDVDLLPQNSLKFARIQHELGITGSYYFRAVPESWDEDIILKIHGLGHEVGYHYESLTTCNGNMEKAYVDFKRNLERLRKLVPVATICMHGSPRSPHDSKDLWKHYDYRTLGILGEPYFDLNFGTEFAHPEQQTPNNKPRTTNNKQRTTNNKQRTTNNEQQTTNNEQQTTNNKQRTTNNKQFLLPHRHRPPLGWMESKR